MAAMRSILICTEVEDVHGTSVHLALERMGHHAQRWFGSDLPQHDAISAELDGGFTTTLRSGEDRIDLETYDTVWHRRIGAPLPCADLLEADRLLAERECRIFLDSFLLKAAPLAFWVNPPAAARQVERSKLDQLVTARRLGWAVPATLISNDPARIRTFLRRNRPHQVVVKPFRQIVWRAAESDQYALAFTAVVNEESLPCDRILRQCPSIYQQRIRKAHELRITCMGQHVVATRLNSQRTEAQGQLDWRSVEVESLGVEEVVLPEQVNTACLKLLEALGLVFGCIDLIVNERDEYIFLEVNQMGQFLWIEHDNPNIPMLDAFCRFLISGDPGFRYERSRQQLALADLIEVTTERISADQHLHHQREPALLFFDESTPLS
jgi:hypothetical protein